MVSIIYIILPSQYQEKNSNSLAKNCVYIIQVKVIRKSWIKTTALFWWVEFAVSFPITLKKKKWHNMMLAQIIWMLIGTEWQIKASLPFQGESSKNDSPDVDAMLRPHWTT